MSEICLLHSSTCSMGVTISSLDFSLFRLALSTHHTRCFQSRSIGLLQKSAMVPSIQDRWSQEKIILPITWCLALPFRLPVLLSAIPLILHCPKVYSG